MKIAVASDEVYEIDSVLVRALEARGHTVIPLGAALTPGDHPWVDVAQAAARMIPTDADEAIVLCWSGTGVTIAANKVDGIRAALCHDAQTATAARVWNHANVLCLAHRTLSQDVLREILDAWFAPYDPAPGAPGVARLDHTKLRD